VKDGRDGIVGGGGFSRAGEFENDCGRGGAAGGIEDADAPKIGFGGSGGRDDVGAGEEGTVGLVGETAGEFEVEVGRLGEKRG